MRYINIAGEALDLIAEAYYQAPNGPHKWCLSLAMKAVERLAFDNDENQDRKAVITEVFNKEVAQL